jgi:hypothetical protein
MLQHEHIGLDDHGSSWDECRHKVCGRNTPPVSSYFLLLVKNKVFLVISVLIFFFVKKKILCSVRVSNELGAAHPRTARFSLVVAVGTSFLIGLILSLILIITRNEYPSLFSSDTSVEDPS